MAENKVFTGVTCPSCGRKDAEIIFIDEGSGPIPTVVHKTCSHLNELIFTVSDLFDKEFPRRDGVDVNISSRVLHVDVNGPSDTQKIVEVIKKVVGDTGDYFENYKLTIHFSPEDIYCPFCGSTEGENELCQGKIQCPCGHYEMPLIRYLNTFLSEFGFKFFAYDAEMDRNRGVGRSFVIQVSRIEETKKIFGLIKTKGLKNRTLATGLIRRTPEPEDRVIFIIEYLEGSRETEQLNHVLEDFFGDLMTIIIKQK